MANAGVAEVRIAASMHHASRRTTQRYLHSDRKAVAGAIAAMPDLAYTTKQAATGTDGACAALAQPGDSQRRPVASNAGSESEPEVDSSARFRENAINHNPGVYRSGQTGQTVNLVALPS